MLFATNDGDSSGAGDLAAFAKNLRILRAFRMLKMVDKYELDKGIYFEAVVL